MCARMRGVVAGGVELHIAGIHGQLSAGAHQLGGFGGHDVGQE